MAILKTALQYGLHSARPTADSTNDGVYYRETDTGKTYQSDGSSWTLISDNTTTTYTDENAQDAVGAMIGNTDTANITYVDATPLLKVDVNKQMSIISDSSGLKLSGDSATPGNNKVYGTDGSGVKGWKNDPAGGGSAPLENLAIGIPYTFDNSPWGSYPDVTLYQSDGSGNFTAAGGKLNDGRKSGTTYNNGDHVSWTNANWTTTFDLGAACNIYQILVWGFRHVGDGCPAPSEIKIEYSDDNSSWTTEVDKTGLSLSSNGVWLFHYVFGSASSHRYWRIYMVNPTPSSQSPMISEIEILGTR